MAVVLIREQITHLAYEQMRVLFESDFRNVRAFLQAKADGLLAVARDLAKDELLKTGLELQVFDQVKNLTKNRKTTLGLSEVMVINAQKRLVSRGAEANLYPGVVCHLGLPCTQRHCEER